MNNTTVLPKNQDDILVYDFGFSTFMLKDGVLWLRLNDVWHFLNDQQKRFLLASGVGLCDMPGKPCDGEFVQYDAFISSAPPKAKPALREVKRKALAIMAREGAK